MLIQVDDSVTCPKCKSATTIKECCILCDGRGRVHTIPPSCATVCIACAGTGIMRSCAKCGANCSCAAIDARKGNQS